MKKNPYLIFSPFLLLYIGFVVSLHTDNLWGDEIRYVYYAKNLLQGFYSPPFPNVSLNNGPGYPMAILPFLALHLPLIAIRLLNAVLQYLTIVLLFKILIRFVSFRKTLIFSFFWACYYNSFDFLTLIYCEVFTVFLVTLLLFSIIKAFDPEQQNKYHRYYMYASGLIFGYLVLTKLIFGYVLLILLAGYFIAFLKNRKNIHFRKALIVSSIAFLTVSPYLMYTYHLTGRVMYWGSNGGSNLYCMTTLNEAEYGSWFPEPQQALLLQKENQSSDAKGNLLNAKTRGNSYYVKGYEDSLIVHNAKDWQEISKFEGLERDDAFRRVAIKNIKSNPVKFLKNCFSNVGRILFNYPYSYAIQKPATLLRLPLNGSIILLLLFSLIPTFKNWKSIPFGIRYMIFAVLLYLGGSVVGSSEIRMFTIVVPVLLVWIAYILEKSVKVKFNWKEE